MQKTFQAVEPAPLALLRAIDTLNSAPGQASPHLVFRFSCAGITIEKIHATVQTQLLRKANDNFKSEEDI
jgi:hypothetical protein